MLMVIDEFTRRLLAIVVERKLQSDHVLHYLVDLFVRYAPSDISARTMALVFTAIAVRTWLGPIGVKTQFMQAGSPWENGYNEIFNGKLRDELLNTEIFYTLKEA